MATECTASKLEFHGLGRRDVVGVFDGGEITGDAGGIVLREVERRTHILGRLAGCFEDHRRAERVEHPVERLVKQRVLGICLGYEDLNDHDELCRDRLLALLCECGDIDGAGRRQEADRGKPLAGKSTLNRLELTPAAGPEARYKKTVADTAAMDALLVDLFLESREAPPAEIVLDVDATDDPLHGGQEGRFFSGHYDCYCYLPLYVFCGGHLLCARLRSASVDAADGTVGELERIVSRIRARWPAVRIAVRGDGGFCREEIMAWCEAAGVDYAFGLAKNSRLTAMASAAMYEARVMHEMTGEAQRVFDEMRYRTLGSWSRARRVVAKAEHNGFGANPRFVVTSVGAGEWDCQALYEDFYCARGDMENRIKEQQLDMFADRTSTARMHANQVRLYFASFAYVLMQTLRRVGLAGTELAKAQCGTIRDKVLKVGAQVRVSVRRVCLSFAETWPRAALLGVVLANLRTMPLRCRGPGPTRTTTGDRRAFAVPRLRRRGGNPPNPGGTSHRTTHPPTRTSVSRCANGSRTPDEVPRGETAGANRPQARQMPVGEKCGLALARSGARKRRPPRRIRKRPCLSTGSMYTVKNPALATWILLSAVTREGDEVG